MEEGERADEEHRSGEEDERRGGEWLLVPLLLLLLLLLPPLLLLLLLLATLVAEELQLPVDGWTPVAEPAPVGLGVPTLLREDDEEEEEEDAGDKIELLLRAFLCGFLQDLPATEDSCRFSPD